MVGQRDVESRWRLATIEEGKKLVICCGGVSSRFAVQDASHLPGA
jgi:hypothetical protein